MAGPPDFQLNEATKALVAAAERLAASRPGRHRPSPSSIDSCTRANWAIETGVTPKEIPDAEAYISAESGRLTEPLLEEVVNESGLVTCVPMTDEERELTPEQLAPLYLNGGQFDRIGHTPEGELVLVEFKRKGVRDMLAIAEQGLRDADPKDYNQLQVLMSAIGVRRALIFVANWDRGQLTRAQKRGAARTPGLYGEWVTLSAPSAIALANRAKMQQHYIQHEKNMARVPRDFDPLKGVFPCTWCPVRIDCLAAEGVKRKPGRVGE